MEKNDFFKDLPRRGAKHLLATMAWAAFCTGTVYAQEWIDVTDTYITNADFSTGTTDGWDAGTALPGVNATWLNAEFFQSYNSASQNVLGLKAGHYKLTVQGFHRAGGNDNGAAYNAGTEIINAYLFAGKDSVKLKSLYSEPADASVANQLNGWPNGMEGLNAWLTKYPESYLNELTFTVQQDGRGMLMGIASNINAGGTWSCWDNFKLYFEGSAFDAFSVKISKLETLRDSLETLGIASASELTALVERYGSYNENTPETEIAAASVILEENTATAFGLCTKGAELTASMAKATELLAQMEDGTYNVTDAVKQELQDAIGTAEEVLKLSTMKEVTEAIGDGITAMNTATSNAVAYISLSYSLQKAKVLADRIGGLAETEAYKNVAGMLSSTVLSYDEVALAVQTLNAVCYASMTPDFLATASDDNPVELTSFIANPNVFQTVSETTPPSGWDCYKGAADGKWYTSTEGTGNSDLFCNSWTGSRLSSSRYGQLIGGDEEGKVKLPDGLYTLKAATYTSAGAANVHLYASTDSVDFAFAEANEDWEVYVDARDALSTTTETQDFEVRDGKLYIGMVCDGPTGGNGPAWYADNFRLYYIKSDVTSAYRDRLQARLDTAQARHTTLLGLGIDDSEQYGIALDPEEGYPAIIESGQKEDMELAIRDLDELNAEADSIIAHYEALYPLLSNGTVLYNQLNEGRVVAQPKVTAEFSAALEDATAYSERMTWDNYLDEEMVRKTVLLDGTIRALKVSIALCFPMSKAKTLADQIGGLTESEAYKDVVALLKSDEIDPIDADEFTELLKMECVEAMTPEVMEKAKENPLDMTSFIVNPNINQNAVDDNNTPINTVVEGWECISTGDSPARTWDLSGDTWLSSWSWSGNAAHNIASSTDYHQVLGNYGAQESKVALPVGAYRVEAATWCTKSPELLQLYALTRQVSTEIVPDINQNDSIVYLFSDSVYAEAAFNGELDVWDVAQHALETTTFIPEVYVENGTLVIGIKGSGVITGNAQYWFADNFRLYYVGPNKGDNISAPAMDNNDLMKEVDVYDLSGRMVRRQVRKSEALRGLHKGIYILDGKKYVVK